jgi:hypothetical protein
VRGAAGHQGDEAEQEYVEVHRPVGHPRGDRRDRDAERDTDCETREVPSRNVLTNQSSHRLSARRGAG